MEERQGISAYLGGIIRIVIFIVLIILLVFFVVRFVQNRRASERAEQVVNTTQRSNENERETRDSADANERDTEGAQDQNGATDTGSRDPEGADQDIPSGVADGDTTPSTGPRAIPEAGIGESIALSTLLLSVVTFLAVKNRQYQRNLG